MNNSIEIAKKYFTLANNGNLNEIEKMFTDRSTYSSQNTGVFLGVNQIMNMMRPFFDAFKTLKWDIKSIDETSDGVVLFDFVFSGETLEGKRVIIEGLEYVIIYEDKIQHFLENDVPKNIICTYSLNTQTIIDNEEHLTASLNKRVTAARKLADKGVKVGFHFHPIVEYENYLVEYKEVYDKLINEFKTTEVALISFGTLTFIKPVIKQLRNREFRTKITQIPHADASGKTSYPDATKVEMFKHAYESFKPWHKEVFFYLCMEEHQMWAKTFGYQYSTNNDFERAMLSSYANKLDMDFLI